VAAVCAAAMAITLGGDALAQGTVEHLMLGDIARHSGNYDAAITEYRAALASLDGDGPGAARVNLSLALIYRAMGRKQDQRMAYEEAIRLDANNAIAQNNLAYLLGDMEIDLDRALGLAQRARKLLPNSDEVADTLGWVHMKRKETNAALEIFGVLCAKNSSSATFFRHLGLALQQLGDRRGAIAAFRKALAANPSAEQRSQIAQSLHECGEQVDSH
jgi:tetratricopeptide (TPR) repeat protein